jgi:chromosome segregation ATPase
LRKYINWFEIALTLISSFLEHLEVNELDFEIFEKIKEILIKFQDENTRLKEEKIKINQELTKLKEEIDQLSINFFVKIRNKMKIGFCFNFPRRTKGTY